MLNFRNGICLLVVTALFAPATRLPAEDLEGGLSVVGNRVTVSAFREDKSAAVGARVRVVKAGLVVVEGAVDSKGVWASEIDKAGAYEIWLGTAASDDDLTKMPFAIAADRNAQPSPSVTGMFPCCQGPFLAPWRLSESEPRRFPWEPAAAGLGLLALAASLLLYFRWSRSMQPE